MDNPTCTVPDCDKPARSGSADWCKMHYHRWYRHRDITRTAHNAEVTVSLGRRYRTLHKPDHPLAMKSGRVYEHRAVLYDKIGPGPHKCHWCGTRVEWVGKCQPFELQPDHLNDDGGDNRPENLAPACRTCNTARGSQRRADALRNAGWWAGNDTVGRLGTGRRERIDPRAA